VNDDFAAHNRVSWAAAIAEVFGAKPPQSATWTDPLDMIRVLTPFMRTNLDHTMLPEGGGLDMDSIAQSSEPGCLEFRPEDELANIFRPASLHFEHFPESPWNSFFLLETEVLPPSGVYESMNGEHEELVELSPGKYIADDRHDTGILGYDEHGAALPIPETSRRVCRHMQPGRFLIVAKSSIWNQTGDTYDGRHNRMTAKQIRDSIQRAINRLLAN